MPGGSNEMYGRDEIVAVISSVVAPLVRKQTETDIELLATLNDIRTGQQLTNQQLAQVARITDAHEHMLRGNGSAGLLTRVASVEAKTANIENLLDDVIDALRGSEDKPGVIGRVSQLEIKAEGLAKPMWIILSALLGTGVTLMITQLLK
jgi:hypothetical protein